MEQLYHIAPTTVRWAWLAIPMVILLIVIGGAAFLAVRSISGARSSTFELSDSGLRIRGDIYGRFIPAAKLAAVDARRVDISSGPYRPGIRTLGTAVPGYRSGWFRLANGSKALLYVTDPSKVVYIPTTEGYSLMLSVAETQAFLDQIHGMAK